MPVYLVAADALGAVKIGLAKSPTERLRNLQTAIPTKLTLIRLLDGGAALEQGLHHRFASARITGEWFHFSQAMMGDVGAADLPLPQPKVCPPELRKPALIIAAFGGTAAVGALLGASRTAVCNWRHTGIPSKFWPKLAREAAKAGPTRAITMDVLECASEASA
jgi:hypothetical protein